MKKIISDTRLVGTDLLERNGITIDSWNTTSGVTSFNVTGHRSWLGMRDERDGVLRRLSKAHRTLALLLELEPALERYRVEVESRFGTVSDWDLEGMEKAIEFRTNEALAKKYAESPAVKETN